MTERKSQLVIPINPNNLFTTLVSTAIIAILSYIWVTIPNQITELKENDLTDIKKTVYRIEIASKNTNRRIEGIIKGINAYYATVRDIEKTLFTKRDALTLEKKMMSEMKIELSPFIQDIEILKNNYSNLQSTELRSIDNKG